MSVCITDYNINEQSDYLSEFFRPEVEGKGLKFSNKNGLHSDKAVIKTDKEKLNAILINLRGSDRVVNHLAGITKAQVWACQFQNHM